MPEEIVDALARVAAALPEVHWPEPEQIRRTARRRQRRRGVMTAFVLVLLAAGGAGILRTVNLADFGAGHSGQAGAGSVCAGGLVPAKVALPELRDIKIRVYNGTGADDVAADVGGQLRTRGLTVLSMTTASAHYDGTALIQYGPDTVGAAWVMRSFFADQAETQYSVDRRDDAVDVTIGVAFGQLTTPAELNGWIARLGRAVLPPGTCEAG